MKHFVLSGMKTLFGTTGNFSVFHLTGKKKWSSEEWNAGTGCQVQDEELQFSSPAPHTPSSPEPSQAHSPACSGHLSPPTILAVLARGNVLARAAFSQHPSLSLPVLILCPSVCSVTTLQSHPDLVFLPRKVRYWTPVELCEQNEKHRASYPDHSLLPQSETSVKQLQTKARS